MAETYNVKILCDGKTIDNSKFRSGFTFENLLMSSDVFSVGECNSNSFKITILNEGVSYKGKTIFRYSERSSQIHPPKVVEAFPIQNVEILVIRLKKGHHYAPKKFRLA